MMADRVQTYKKHARLLPPFHFFVLPVLFVNFLNSLRHLVQAPTLHYGFEVIVAAALVTLAFMSRVQALTVQDRVIRLEMRHRLRGILPPDLQQKIDQLTHRQMVALRFASDAEMPDLVRDVCAGKLATSKDIKVRIKDWQADWLRA
jgi:hypothetical protein